MSALPMALVHALARHLWHVSRYTQEGGRNRYKVDLLDVFSALAVAAPGFEFTVHDGPPPTLQMFDRRAEHALAEADAVGAQLLAAEKVRKFEEQIAEQRRREEMAKKAPPGSLSVIPMPGDTDRGPQS